MGQIRACLFDLDGVIVDTARYHYQAWRRLAEELGFPLSEQQNERLKGVSRMRSLEILLEIGQITVDWVGQEELAAQKNQWYVEMISRMGPSDLLPGARRFLDEVRSSGLQMALGSASKNAMLILRNTGLLEVFDVIIDGNRTTQAKPDPEVFLLAARDLGVEPCDSVVFEDAAAGIEAARRAGMYAVGIGSPEVLGAADLVVSGLHEMTVERLLRTAAARERA